MLDKLRKIADALDAAGHLEIAGEIDQVMKAAQGLAPRSLQQGNPNAGYTDPSKVKVRTKGRGGQQALPGPATHETPGQRAEPEVPTVPNKPLPPAKNSSMLVELHAIATELDRAGHFDLADQVENILAKSAKSKKNWMQDAVNPKEKGELRKKMKAKPGESIPDSKLKSEKKKLQEKAKGDKKLSKADRERLSQIQFALNARKSKKK